MRFLTFAFFLAIPAFAEWPERMADTRIQARVDKAVAARSAT